MSGRRQLYTPSGRLMPPPPRRTPRRKSSVCRLPPGRYTSAGRPSPLTLRSNSARCESCGHPLPGVRSERSASSEGRAHGHFRSRLERGDRGRRGSRGDEHTHDGRRGAALVDERSRSGRAQWDRGNNGFSNSPRYSRTASQYGYEFYNSKGLAERLRRSLSRGHSPRRRGSVSQAVVGTELMAPMPRLQGAHCTSRDRDRMTIERFIQCQPLEAQDDMRVMLEEYKDREKELCLALSEAYAEPWESVMKGNDTAAQFRNNSNRETVTFVQDRGHVASKRETSVPTSGERHSEGGSQRSNHQKTRSGCNPKCKTKPARVASPPAVGSQGDHRSSSYYRTNSDFITPHREERANWSASLGRERYDDDVTPQPRRGPGGPGGRASTVLHNDTVLDHRRTPRRHSGMLTPSVPSNLVAR